MLGYREGDMGVFSSQVMGQEELQPDLAQIMDLDTVAV